MFPLNPFEHFVQGLRVAYRRNRMERIVDNLPPELKKDIGWPAISRENPPVRRD